MRSLLLILVSVVGLGACGDIVPLTPDAAPCSACDENATCSNNACVCDTGWEGNGETCTDVNECMTNNGGCDPNAACFNNDGGRNCGCNTGFVGDGMTCRQVWTLRGSAAINLSNAVPGGGTNDAVATVVGGTRIYFAPDVGSDGDSSAHFLRYFDISTMTFNTGGSLALPPAGSSDFCACGYTQVFVGTSTDLYMFGNDGFRYNPALNQWTAISAYTPLRRGEAAGAFEGNNGTIYMIGGRGPLNTALRFQVSGQTFITEGGTLPNSVDSAVAWAPAGNNIVYVAGGSWSDNNRRHLVSHPTGTSTWTPLPDAPADISSPNGMGDWQGKLWITTRQQMFFYDIATMTWLAPITLPPSFITAVTAGNRTFGLIQNNAMLEVHELTAIE